MNHSKRAQLLALAEIIDAYPDWWRFPTENVVQGFLGTDPLFIVGDQPSTSQWDIANRNRRALYDLLPKIGTANAHLTDLYKRRGRSGALKDGLPEDFPQHIDFFRKEIEILRPTRVVALGHHAYQLLAQHTPELKPILKRVWHFSYVVRYNKLPQYEANMRDGIESGQQVIRADPAITAFSSLSCSTMLQPTREGQPNANVRMRKGEARLPKPRIHFVENLRLMRSLGPSSLEWESGYWWRIGKANADALIGGGIYFHTSQSEPSYAGGIITGYRIEPQGKFKGRYVFTYHPSPDYIGVITGPEGWAYRYKKLIL